MGVVSIYSVGADWPVIALELFSQVVVGIRASCYFNWAEGIDVNVVSAARQWSAAFGCFYCVLFFLWKIGEMFCDSRVENSSSGQVDVGTLDESFLKLF